MVCRRMLEPMLAATAACQVKGVWEDAAYNVLSYEYGATHQGAPVRVYHAWTLMDNFEWTQGYSQRFGLMFVDFGNGQKCTIKDAGRWHAKAALANHAL